MADFAGIHQFLERSHGVADGDAVFPVAMLVTQAAKVVGGALRPVQLIKVDDIGLQALEAAFHGPLQAVAVESRAAAYMLYIVAGTGGLGGQDHLVTVAGAGEPFANDGFRTE